MIYMYKLADIQLTHALHHFAFMKLSLYSLSFVPWLIYLLWFMVIAAVSTSIKETVGNYSSKKSEEAW